MNTIVNSSSSPDFQLALAFIQAHPNDAGRILELQPIDQSVALLQVLPQPLAHTVLINMLPLYASRLCTHMEVKTAVELLSARKINEIVPILRFINRIDRETLLAGLPLEMATRCRLLLSYSQDMVGAWMVTHPMMLFEEFTVAEALERFSIDTTVAAIDTSAIYIVDRELRLQGIISMPALLRASRKNTVSMLLDRQTYAVSGRASLGSVQYHSGWAYRDALPVVNRNRQLIGMLRHVDLRQGLDSINQKTEKMLEPIEAPLINLYRTYSGVLIELLNVFNDIAGNPRKFNEK